MTFPTDTKEITISQDGNVTVVTGNNIESQQIGQFQLVRFQNPAGLLSIGHNLYQETSASGNAVQGTPGQQGMGVLEQGFLESVARKLRA